MKRLFNTKVLSLITIVALVVVMMSVGGGFVPSVNALGGTTYYVDSVNGVDTNSGTADTAAWKSLDKVNSVTFQPGDKILFKAGCTWVCGTGSTNNALKPKGSGASGSPISIDMYGTGNKPIIQGNGAASSSAVTLTNQAYWEINNLQVLNQGSTTSGQQRRGIYILANASAFTGTSQSSPAVLSHIYIRNCEVRNVDSNVTGMDNYNKSCGGIIFNILSASTDTGWVKYDDIRVENNYIHDLSRMGLFTYSDFCMDAPYTNGEGTRPRLAFTNVAVRNNYCSDVGGDGLVLTECDSPVMEHNLVARPQRVTGSSLFAVGIWTWGCYNSVMQFNESYGNQSSNDGEGYDIDYASKGTILQYNYSHDNQGGFLLVCSGGGRNENAIARYNISQNDGGISGSRSIVASGAGTSNAQIYNNTIYTSTSTPVIIDSGTGGWFGAPSSVVYSNNIIWDRKGSATYNITSSTSFKNNDFYGGSVPSYSTGQITANPMLASPGTATTGGRIDQGQALGNVDGYKLQTGSPCINAGVAISNNGGRDYWGNTLDSVPDIGAYDTAGGSGTPTPTTTPTPTPTAGPTATPTPTSAASVWYQNFESGTGFTAGSGATVAIDNSTANSGGAKSVKMTLTASGDPGNNTKCVNAAPQAGSSVSASGYSYLMFFIKDTQGANTHKVTIVDTSNAVWSGWTSDKSVQNQWTKISLPLSSVTGVNLSAIKEIRLGEWNTGTYYFDDIYFAQSTSSPVPGF